jgi:hypothetical protein
LFLFGHGRGRFLTGEYRGAGGITAEGFGGPAEALQPGRGRVVQPSLTTSSVISGSTPL